MDLRALQDRLSEAREDLTRRRRAPHGVIAVPHYEHQKARIEWLMSYVSQRILAKEIAERRETRSHQTTMDIQRARKLFLEGKRFCSFDVEVDRDTRMIQEIGITMIELIGGRPQLSSYNYIIKGAPKRTIPFMFGRSIEGSLDVMARTAKIHAESANYYVGQSLKYDLQHLDEFGFPRKYYYDTARLGAVVSHTRGVHRSPKLYDLVRMFNIPDNGGFHCGGNDARYAALVFLALIGF